MAIKIQNGKVSKKTEVKKPVGEKVFKAKKGTMEALIEAAEFAAEKKLTNEARR